MFRVFTLLKMLTSETMVYYASWVSTYRAAAPLVKYPLEDGEGVVARFRCMKEVKAAVLYCCVPSLHVRRETMAAEAFGAFPVAVLTIPPAWGKIIGTTDLDQATEMKEAEAPEESPQMQWWERFVMARQLAEVFKFLGESVEKHLEEMLEWVIVLIMRRGFYWKPEVEAVDWCL